MPLSISKKLAATVVLSVGFSGLLTGSVGLWQNYSIYARSRRDALLEAAQAYAAGIARPVSLRDTGKIFDVVRGIGGLDHFKHAVVRDLQGSKLADVGYSAELDGDAKLDSGTDDQSLFELLTSHTIKVTAKVTDAGRDVGELEILADAGDLLPGLLDSARLNLLGTLIALTIGLAFATRVQAAIIRPLKGLTNAMTRVRASHDFSEVLPEQGGDEIGVLVAGYNTMLSDIRDRDARLQLHRERLEQDVADRTHDLAVARDEAERANAAKSDFLATMSHEIRTPMSGMLVMAELLASGELPARSRRYAEVISQSGQALLAIINDILDFAKIEAGKMELEDLDVDVEQVVGTVLNLFHARAREKGLDLAARIAPDLPLTLTADPVRLTQVISNLVGNALKFTEHGSVTIEVAWSAAPVPTLRIAVTDTGIGIPADKLEAIFEAFGQADQSTTRQFGGTGLGLAISNRLVRAMGAEIKVESRVGQGSTFSFAIQPTSATPRRDWPELASRETRAEAWVRIDGGATRETLIAMLVASGFDVAETPESRRSARPVLIIADEADLVAKGTRLAADYVVALAQPDGQATPALVTLADVVLTWPVLSFELRAILGQIAQGERLKSPARSRQMRVLPSYPQARILAADDAVVNREVLAEALMRFGIRPTLVTNGAEALEAMGETRFDLVLMDGSMPILDGFETSRRRRQYEYETGAPRTPIVALTAHVVGTAATAWRDAGMDGLLHKPFTIDDLDRCLAVWLSGCAVASPADDDADDISASEQDLPLLNDMVVGEIMTMSGATGGAFAARVFSLYRTHSPAAVDEITAAAGRNDSAALAAAAHGLKSMSLNIGAARVADLAASLERAALADGAEPCDIDLLQKVLTQTLAALDRTAAGTGDAPIIQRAG